MFYAEKKYGASIRLYELKDKNVKGRETLWDKCSLFVIVAVSLDYRHP